MKKQILRYLSIVLVMVLLTQIAPLNGIIPAVAAPLPQLTEVPSNPDMPQEASRHVSEEVSLRTADTRHFRNEDGSFTVYTYPEIIHFEDENGDWQEIDNTLVRQGDFYVPKASNLDVSLPGVLGENMVTVRSGRFGISLGVPGANSEAVVPDLNFLQQAMIGYFLQDAELDPDAGNAEFEMEDFSAEMLNQQMSTVRNLQSVVYYFDAFEGAHLEYVISPDGIKENIVVVGPKDAYVYEFRLELDNLIAVQQTPRLIRLHCSVSGTLQASIEAPFAVDAAGAKNYLALTIELDGNALTLSG